MAGGCFLIGCCGSPMLTHQQCSPTYARAFHRSYLVATPEGRLSNLQAELLDRSWQSLVPSRVKVLAQEEELYIIATESGSTP